MLWNSFAYTIRRVRTNTTRLWRGDPFMVQQILICNFYIHITISCLIASFKRLAFEIASFVDCLLWGVLDIHRADMWAVGWMEERISYSVVCSGYIPTLVNFFNRILPGNKSRLCVNSTHFSHTKLFRSSYFLPVLDLTEESSYKLFEKKKKLFLLLSRSQVPCTRTYIKVLRNFYCTVWYYSSKYFPIHHTLTSFLLLLSHTRAAAVILNRNSRTNREP